MATRATSSAPLSTRARVCTFYGTSINAATACTLEDDEITFELMLRSGVTAKNLRVAGIGPVALKKRGVKTVDMLRQLGVDALHLCDADFCNECMLAYGTKAVSDAFLLTAADAVSLAGTPAMEMLNISTLQLLEQCAGFPGEALAVLQQLPQGTALRGVPCKVLLDAGLRFASLRRVGYGVTAITDQVGPSSVELSKLGFATC